MTDISYAIRVLCRFIETLGILIGTRRSMCSATLGGLRIFILFYFIFWLREEGKYIMYHNA